MIPLWRLTTLRRKLFEALGSSRHSRPGYEGIDAKLAAQLGPGGFYVEAGAVDGVFESNTYFLERFHGWRGVLVEPVPAMYSRLKVNRPAARAFNCALVSHEFRDATVEIRPAHAMSSVVSLSDSTGAGDGRQEPKINVPARTLDSILDEAHAPEQFDLLSLDVEGYEIEVLSGMDFRRYRPRAIVVECLDQASRGKMDDFLAPWYVMTQALSYRDFLYSVRAG